MRTYQEANAYLGRKQDRPLEGRATRVERRQNGDIVVRYQSTDVVTYKACGDTVLNSGGWRSVTTKERMNAYSPIQISQANGQWTCWGVMGEPLGVFADGLILHADGTITGMGKDQSVLRKQAAAYAKDYIAALYAGNVETPGPGDCWYCYMREQATGKPLGDLTRDDHLELHIAERYYVPSMITNALEAMPSSQVMRWTVAALLGLPGAERSSWVERGKAWNDSVRPEIEKCLRRYLYKGLGLAY